MDAVIYVYALTHDEAASIVAGHPEWCWISEPRHLIGLQDPVVVMADHMRERDLGYDRMMAELDARSARIFTEFDFQQGRVR